MKQEKTIGLFLLIMGALFYAQSSGLLSYLSHRNDFAHLYLAGYLADRGGDFFNASLMLKAHKALAIPTGLNPFVYPPFFALLLIPLSWFSFDTAWTFFFIVSHLAYLAALALTIRLLCKPGDSRLFWWGILLSLSACFYPLPRTYSAGQMNTFILLCIIGAYFLYTRKRDWAAGITLGFGAAIKVSPAFLLVYFAWKGRWKTVMAGGLTILISVLLSLAWLGPERHREFLQEVKQMSYGSSTWAQYGQHYHVEPHNQAPSAVWYRLLTHNPSTTGIIDSPSLAKTFSNLTALVILASLLFLTPVFRGPCTFWEYGLWTIAMLLLPSLFWDHYLVQIIPVIAYALYRQWTEDTKWGLSLAIGTALLALPYYYDNPYFKHGFWTLLMAIKLAGILLLVAWLLGNRPKETENE